METRLTFVWIILLSSNLWSFSVNSRLDEVVCPCIKTSWCDPIKDTSRKEVFAFSIRNDESHWQLFDWSKLTTVVMFGYINDRLMCLAHSHNVRLVMLGSVDKETFVDPTKRSGWIKNQFQLVKAHFLDGLNFDFEDVIAANESSVRDAYTALVKETREFFKQELPFSQISVDVAWKTNIDLRFYDYKQLADNSDLLFVMAYDEQSQIFGQCLAGPNSAYGAALDGLTSYLDGPESIPADKLVLGVPWYGYIYPCLDVQDGDKCIIQPVPFRGVNCSDAAGKQFDYNFIYLLAQTMPDLYQWNSSAQTPYITYQDKATSKYFQVQFDDPTSLKAKYDLASKLGLRGVGMWNIDSLDYTDSAVGRQIRAAMFSALPSRSLLSSQSRKSDRQCPCSKAELCNPITEVGRKEVYAFSLVNDENHWNKFDWSRITTICMFHYVNVSLMCLAHSHNVRAVVLGDVTIITMITPELRAQWVKDQLQIVQDNFLDGLNFDLEYGIPPQQKDLRDAYTALVTETYTALKHALPFSQISIDVTTNAYSTYRAYDYPALAAVSDFLFIMAYDESGFDTVGSNSDYFNADKSITSFLQRNISADKLVLGLPWYGYIYTCYKLVGDACYLNSSADPHHAGQYDYKIIYQLLETVPDSYRWNASSKTPYFSYVDPVTGKSYQVQYDDPKSLKLKYDLAASRGIRGVGFWTIDFLDYSDTKEGQTMRQSMFSVLPIH